jgi:hypothetical protein
MPLYHLARPDDVPRLIRDGFSTGGIQAWAQGVYLATDDETARLYESLEPDRVRLAASVEVNRPFRLVVPDGDHDQFQILQDAFRRAFGNPQADRISRESLRALRKPLAAEVTAILKGQGYDALEVDMGPVALDDQRSVTLGGNQLVVFDPARVRLEGPALSQDLSADGFGL